MSGKTWQVPIREDGTIFNDGSKVISGKFLEEVRAFRGHDAPCIGDTFDAYAYGAKEPWGGVWEESKEFQATLTVSDEPNPGQSFGRMPRVVLIDDVHSMKYTMFVNDFVSMLQKVDVVDRKVHGTFDFLKKGSSYSIVFVRP